MVSRLGKPRPKARPAIWQEHSFRGTQLGSEIFAFVRMAVGEHALSTRNISMASQNTSKKQNEAKWKSIARRAKETNSLTASKTVVRPSNTDCAISFALR